MNDVRVTVQEIEAWINGPKRTVELPDGTSWPYIPEVSHKMTVRVLRSGRYPPEDLFYQYLDRQVMRYCQQRLMGL